MNGVEKTLSPHLDRDTHALSLFSAELKNVSHLDELFILLQMKGHQDSFHRSPSVRYKLAYSSNYSRILEPLIENNYQLFMIERLILMGPSARSLFSCGKNIANVVLLRGCGIRIEVSPFAKKHGLWPCMVAPTKIIAGLGLSLGIDILEAPGATGDYRTLLTSKATAIAKALSAPLQSCPNVFVPGEDEHKPGRSDGYDFGFLHIKAIDDAGHDKATIFKCYRCGNGYGCFSCSISKDNVSLTKETRESVHSGDHWQGRPEGKTVSLRLHRKVMPLYCDNKAAIEIAHNPVQHDRTKHVEVDRHFIEEKLDGQVIYFPFVPTEEQLADILTKALLAKVFRDSLDKLDICDLYVPT
ncbi:hypothetical protein ACLB2K_047145 [Fragaria x ananassa]